MLIFHRIIVFNLLRNIRHSFDKNLYDLLTNSFGSEKAEELATVLNERAPLTIRANIVRTTRDELYSTLKRKGFDVKKTHFSPYGITFLTHPKVYS